MSIYNTNEKNFNRCVEDFISDLKQGDDIEKLVSKYHEENNIRVYYDKYRKQLSFFVNFYVEGEERNLNEDINLEDIL